MTSNQQDLPIQLQFASRQVTVPDFKSYGLANARAHKDQVYSVKWSTDGKRLGSVSNDKSLRIWPEKALDSIRPEVRLSTAMLGHTEKVLQLAWHPLDSNLLSTVSLDKTVRFWDIREKAPTCTIQLPQSALNVTYHPSGDTLAVGADNIHFYDLRKVSSEQMPQQLFIKQQEKDRINHDFRWSTDGELFAIGSGDGKMETYLWPSFELEYSVEAHTADVTVVDFSKDRRYMLTGGGDGVVNVWDLYEWICLRSISQIEGLVRSLSISANSEFVAIGTDDRSIAVASLHTGETLYSFNTGAKTNSLAWHPTKNILAFSSEELSREEHLRDPGFPGVSPSVRMWGRNIGR